MQKSSNNVQTNKYWAVKFTNNAGEDQKVQVASNGEYRIKLKNGKEMYATFSGFKTNKNPDGKSILAIGVLMNPGYLKAMVSGENTEEIDVSTLEELTRVDSKYTRSKRSAKSIEVDKNSTRFAFAFDTKKFSTQYKITVYRGEFVSLVYRAEDEDRSHTLYGEVEDVDGDDIIFTHYKASGGVRSIINNVRIPSAQVTGIYRYELEFEPHKDKEKDAEAKRPKVVKLEATAEEESN